MPLFRLPRRSRAAIAREVDAELEFHLAMRVSALTASGLSADDARRQAVEEFGDIERTRAYCRAVDARTERAVRMVDRWAEWRQDIRYALRTLRRSPTFTAVSLLTLAVAIGANTAIFSVLRAVVLAPLPYGAPGALVRVSESRTQHPHEPQPISPPNYIDFRTRQHTLSDLGAFAGSAFATWTSEHADPVALSELAVTPSLFHVLQVPPLYGRTFAPGEDTPGHDDEIVVSYGFWKRWLGGDTTVVGRPITLDGRAYTIIGIMPKGFTVGAAEDLWRPLDLSDDLAHPERTRKQHYLFAIGRLKAGVTLDAARADLVSVARRLDAEYPDANTALSAMAVPLHDAMVGSLRPALLLLQGAAALVLLIACANQANLTLSRALDRRRELAVRSALGAGRGRLVRQLVTESVVLAATGGALGIGLAALGARVILALNPDSIPAMFSGGLDGGVLLFSITLSIVTGVGLGIVPGLVAAGGRLGEALKSGARGTSGRSAGRIGRALVVTQVALAVILLVGAGLLIRSFDALMRVRVGFAPDHVLTARLRTVGQRYDSAAMINRYYDGVLDAVARTPGVVAVGAIQLLPMEDHWTTAVRIEGQPVDEGRLPDAGFMAIRGEYFAAMRIPLLAGRTFDASNRPADSNTVIVNDAAAKRFFPKGDALGERIRIGPDPHGSWLTIIGIVGDVRDEALDVPAKPALFLNHRQNTWLSSLAIVVRTSGDPAVVVPALRRAVKAMDPTLAVRDVRSLDDVVAASLAPRRLALGLASSFAAVALLLAALGIYGVLAYTVAARTRELGVRLALGATPHGVLLLVVRQGTVWAALGLALGVGGAIAFGRLLAGMLYGVGPTDAATYVLVVLTVLAVVGVACLVPARRATRVDPLTCIRAE
ncbi:MAG TPA: ABC transporter permease [Gemmatimonadaceae bacterium]|nr:ABC transporter permease [Gemmatimonadaceae bacterium]